MKRTKIREWTCDKCGKTATTTSFVRPLSIGKTKFNVSMGLYYYREKWDLCTECAYTLTDILEKYMSKKEKGE